MHNDLALRIDAVRRKQARITAHVVGQMAILASLDDDLCALLREAAQAATEAGHIDAGTAATVIAPK